VTTEKILASGNDLGAALRPRFRLRDICACVVGLFELLDGWRQHMRDRRQLLSLSDHTLKDIGISRATAEQAANEPFRADTLWR